MTYLETIGDWQAQGPRQLAAALLVILAVFIVFQCRSPWRSLVAHDSACVTNLPGPKRISFLSGMLTADEVGLASIAQAAKRAGQYYDANFFGHGMASQPTLFTSDPAVVRHVLSLNSQKYVHTKLIERLMTSVVGHGLATLTGEAHRRHRTVAMPTLSAKTVAENVVQVETVANDLVDHLCRKLRDASTGTHGHGYAQVELLDAFTRASTCVMGRIVSGRNFHSMREGQQGPIAKALGQQTDLLARLSLYQALRWSLPAVGTIGYWLGVRDEMDMRDAKARVTEGVRQMVDEASQAAKAVMQAEGQQKDDTEKQDGTDVLGRMLRNNISSGLKGNEQVSEEAIVAISSDLLFAGSDTTSITLSWAVFAMTRGPDCLAIQRRLRQELNSAEADGWQHDYGKLDRIEYLDAVMRETMRIHPAALILVRQVECKEGDTITLSKPVRGRDGRWMEQVHLRKGDAIVIRIGEMNESEEYWGPDAKQFRPERWLGRQDEQQNADGKASGGHGMHAFPGLRVGWSGMMTFGAGPKGCIGFRMAHMVFKVIIANVITKFEFLPTDDVFKVQRSFIARPFLPDKGVMMPILVRPIEQN